MLSLNWFGLSFAKTLIVQCWFSSIRCPCRSLYMQLYPLDACNLDQEENLFDIYLEPIAFGIKILMNETLI